MLMYSRLLTLLFIVLSVMKVTAQQTSGLYLSVNPFSIVESQSTYGAGLGYFNEKFEICTEIGQLNPPLWGSDKFVQIQGYRSVTRFKYFFVINDLKQSKTFVGAEFRYKNFAYDDIADFVNNATGITLKDYVFRNNTQVKAYAALIGKQFDMCESGRWVIEFSLGVGIRTKHIQRENTPPNTYIVPVKMGFGETPNYVDNYTSVHVPIGIRIFVKL